MSAGETERPGVNLPLSPGNDELTLHLADVLLEGADLVTQRGQGGAETQRYRRVRIFEERADKRSFARFSDLELNEVGGFGAGAAMLELYADFTTPFSKKLPIKIGKSYELGLSGFELRGTFPEIGNWTFSERSDTQSSVTLENIRKDAAGKTLRGDATFRMYGLAKMQLQF